MATTNKCYLAEELLGQRPEVVAGQREVAQLVEAVHGARVDVEHGGRPVRVVRLHGEPGIMEGRVR